MQSPEPRRTILVVEDNAEARMLMEDFLSAPARHHRVLSAKDGQEALDLFRKHGDEIDLVLLDVMLPDMSGVEVCRRMKEDESGRLIPVIMVTARGDTSSKVDGFEVGAQDYVTKPINFMELDARIRATLRQRAQTLELAGRSARKHPTDEELEHLLAQVDKLSTIGGMVSEVIHEINNPINGIMNYADILADGQVNADEEVQELVSIIKSEARRISALVDSILVFRREENGMARLDLAEVLDHVLTLSRYQLKKEGIRVVRAYEHGVAWVDGNQGRLVQAFLNLIYNAVQALHDQSGQGKPREITVGLVLDSDTGEVVATVRDNGPGIPAALLPRIFEPDFTTKRPGRGTGLGLPIVDRIVRKHGGSVAVHSNPGEFTEFQLRFPAASGPAA